jgi:hypothetical protein
MTLVHPYKPYDPQVMQAWRHIKEQWIDPLVLPESVKIMMSPIDQNGDEEITITIKFIRTKEMIKYAQHNQIQP